MAAFAVGDRVVRNPATWQPQVDFDSWGRGVGVGVVVEPPFALGPDEADVRLAGWAVLRVGRATAPRRGGVQRRTRRCNRPGPQSRAGLLSWAFGPNA